MEVKQEGSFAFGGSKFFGGIIIKLKMSSKFEYDDEVDITIEDDNEVYGFLELFTK